jgi:hypothetical protein
MKKFKFCYICGKNHKNKSPKKCISIGQQYAFLETIYEPYMLAIIARGYGVNIIPMLAETHGFFNKRSKK